MKRILMLLTLVLLTTTLFAQKADSTVADTSKVRQDRLYYFQFPTDYTDAILRILQNSDESHKVVTLVLNNFIYQIQHQPTVIQDTPPDTSTHAGAAVLPRNKKED